MAELSRIEMFLEVAKQQSFTAAARHLGVTGPALSKQVQALEEALGVKLLQRTTRRVTVTEAGAIFSERARKALEDLAEATCLIQELKSHPIGQLKVNTPMSFGLHYLSKPLAQFASIYPDVQMGVDYDDRHVDVVQEGYDVVVRIGTLADSSLIARKLADCPLLLCASPAYLAKHGAPDMPEQLREHRSIMYSKHDHASEWRYKCHDGEPGVVRMQRHFSANNGDLMLDACIEGLGVAVLPVFLAYGALQSGALVRVLPDYHTYPDRHIYAVFPEKRYLSTKTRLLMDHLTQYCQRLPWVD